jgi:hypothetical protein
MWLRGCCLDRGVILEAKVEIIGDKKLVQAY